MMKQKIMEVLLSADNNLTQEEIQWAALNIPETGLSITFDHDADNIWRACGFTEENVQSLKEEFESLAMNVSGTKKSHLVEHLLTKGSPMLIRNFAIRGICTDVQKSEDLAIEKLKKLIEKYK